MNVLSLFDGCSGGQQALDRLGIKVDNYFASEIDKYAIQVTMANYPNTKQLGSVVNVDGYKLPKIDLLMGGSPCQSFSFAGKRKGMSTKCETEILTLEHYLELKADGYEFEGQSYLFWEYMRLLNECKPTYFLLENVEMGEKWEKVLSKAIGVNGIHINSALVSAQNRKRIYWTNIGLEPSGLFGDLESVITQPKDKGILLKDILESEVNEKYFLSEKSIAYINRNERNLAFQMNENDNKSGCVVARYQSGIPYNQIVVHNTMPRSSTSGKGGTGHLSRNDGKTYCLDTGNTNAVEIKYQKEIEKSLSNEKATTIDASYYKGFGVRSGACRQVVKQISTNNKSNGGTQPYQQDRIYDINGISPALNTDGRGHAVEIVAMRGRGEKGNIEQQLETNGTNKSNSLTTVTKDNLVFNYRQDAPNDINGKKDCLRANAGCVLKGVGIIERSRIRRLTPIECERLQTVADNYTNHVSDSQRYKMLGNGWTIDVIAHILKFAKF